MAHVPDLRLSLANARPERPDGEWVLYWMTAARRLTHNYALQQAAGHARRLGRPIVILEDLCAGRRWDSDRLHAFALQGMADNAARLTGRCRGVLYHPYVETKPGEADALVQSLASRAAVVVADDSPRHDVPDRIRRAAERMDVRMETVDSCGLLPLRAAERAFTTAHSFRAFLQKHLPEHLADAPAPDPLARLRLPALGALPHELTRRWPAASADILAASPKALASLPIDHGVAPVAVRDGGATAAAKVLARFIGQRLDRYADGHSHPDDEATSELSPYLAHGHISVHKVFAAVMQRRGWTPERLGPAAGGRREGWWGVEPGAEAFLDELVTWRELGYNFNHFRDDAQAWASLPAWARATLQEHRRDPRPHVYSPEQLDAAGTHDALWNAAQRQLVRDGFQHNYMRMLWGKKVLEWTPDPAEAMALLLDFNNRYELDGRDPNSTSGVAWVFGRYDRAWGPERPVFGTVRYMTSESARRKLRVRAYLRRYGDG
jgi:deoxyribodipyrimidine photo-lyase